MTIDLLTNDSNMKIDFLKKLCCPFDKHDLNIQVFQQQEDEIKEGILTCFECKRYYPIVYGIPIMSPDEYRETTLELPILQRWGIQENLEAAAFRILPDNNPKAIKN